MNQKEGYVIDYIKCMLRVNDKSLILKRRIKIK